MIPSMSRPGNPYHNASCDSFIETLKREEINAGEYRDLDHLRENIAAFIDGYWRVALRQSPPPLRRTSTIVARKRIWSEAKP